MKEIILQFTYDCTLISVPSDIEKNIQSIRKKFDKWLYDKSKDHDYWVYINGEEYYFKELDNPYNELLGYNACKHLGIDACYTDLAILDGKCGVISKSLRDNSSKLVSGDELLG